jgi:hypothetical protein
MIKGSYHIWISSHFKVTFQRDEIATIDELRDVEVGDADTSADT